ncbi:Gene 36 protein (Gp36), probable excisionase [Mycobacterium canetti]|uniref:helix-turn-helix transcriptional regulator n=1 Tax=Mycobacterium canetti TaxID=78331 RepID=UPI002D788179|nr:helix-turn-helix domain-containing protein [Mycobacterium canetti]WRO41766.1 Gene 36 protein (Gp36), probable excisionase [Mycobacterium canetti]
MPSNNGTASRRERRRPEHEQRHRLISLQDAADRCGVNYRTMRRYIAAGRLQAVRVGPRLLKVDAAELDSLLQPVGGGAA